MFWRTKYLKFYLGSLFIMLCIYLLFVALILLKHKVQQWQDEVSSHLEYCDSCLNHGHKINIDTNGELELSQKLENIPRNKDLIKHIGKDFKMVTDYDFLPDDNHDTVGRNINIVEEVNEEETREEKKMNDNAEDAPSEMDTEQEKYIVYLCVKPCGGWGDRMMGIFTTYIMSRIFQRKFIIAQHHPCDLKSVLLPNTLNWTWPASLQTYMDVLNPAGYNNLYIKYFSILDNNKDFPVNEIMNQREDLNMLYNQHLWVFRTNNAFPWAFSNNPTYNGSITAMGYNESTFSLRNMFRDVYNALFILTPALESRYNSFMQECKNSRLVCTQVRTGQNPSMPDDVELAAVDIRAIWQFIHTKLHPQNDRLFVTTDSEEVRQNASNEFGNVIIDTVGNITHVDRYGSNCNGMEKVALDFHILSQCDLLLVSRSNFGGLAAMLRHTREDLYILYENNIYDATDSETEKKLCEDNRDMKTKTLFCDQEYIFNSF
ncbi:unnamed protein product [Owenia fusiformis]|uniref:Uncharacterized protein n=1 Tax=Owenia fusiformis TaxID=6347 RepID=A0A8J1TZ52_OWEFU|nr:unnamed protein product [Owenia fusiformis]